MAFFQDTKPSREPFINAPASVLALIGIILVAHVARVLLPEDTSDWILTTFAFIPARYVASAWAAAGGDPVSIWDGLVTFVSYQFLHVDFIHVGVNCVWLLVAGTPVARRLGAVWFVVLFLVCGVAAAALYLGVHWGEVRFVVGASGAVSGMMGAAIRIFYGEKFEPKSAADNVVSIASASSSEALGHKKPIAPLFGSPVLFFSLVWTVANVVAGLTGLGTSGNMQAVAWEAHLGGYFAGLLLIGPFDALARRYRIKAM